MKVREKQGDPLLPKMYRVTDLESIEVSQLLDMKIKFMCIPDRINNPDADFCFIRCLLVEMTPDGKDFTDRIALETQHFPKSDLGIQLGIFLRQLGDVITGTKPTNETNPV